MGLLDPSWDSGRNVESLCVLVGVPWPSCAPDDRMFDIPPGWAGPCAFTCSGHPGHAGRVPSLNHVVLRVQAIQGCHPWGVSNMVAPSKDHVL
eukprot:3170135-Pyramimonas_sp.AAC.1